MARLRRAATKAAQSEDRPVWKIWEKLTRDTKGPLSVSVVIVMFSWDTNRHCLKAITASSGANSREDSAGTL